MTIMIPEAAEAVSGQVAKRKAARTVQGRVVSSRTQAPARYRRPPPRPNTRTIPGTGGPEQQARQARSTAAASAAGAAAGSNYSTRLPSGGDSGGGNPYQNVILAEFLVAAGIVAFLPLATGGPPDKNTPSPYQVTDLVQLLALGVVYFILATLTGGSHGRIAAWFGGLVLLGLFYKKFATGELNTAITSIHPASPQAPSGGTLE
jgi:hypothetical protein